MTGFHRRRLRFSLLAPLTLALFALGASGHALAQVTTETVDLLGSVATVSEFQEYPGSTERNLSSTWAFRPDGTAAERVFFSYSFMDGSLRSRTVTTYDDRGLPLSRVTLDPDGNPLAQTVFRYDGDGRMTEEASYDAEGTETRRIVYERDAAGNVVVQERYQDGALDERTEREYDDEGRLLEEREYEEGRLTELETYTEPGRVAEFVEYDDEGEIESTGTFVDGEHGTERWTGYDADGNLAFELTWTYDENGLLRERREVDAEGEEIVYRYEYEFDATGNWVRMVVSEDFRDTPTTVYEVRDRQITYH